MKKVYLIISVIALITFLAGIPELAAGIVARGFTGVNYGRVVFPLGFCVVMYGLYRRRREG